MTDIQKYANGGRSFGWWQGLEEVFADFQGLYSWDGVCWVQKCLAVAAEFLLTLDSLEESLEVAGTESLVAAALDDLDEDSGAVLDGLGEDLEQVTGLVVVNKDIELLDDVQVLSDLGGRALETETQVLIVGGGDAQEVHATGTEVADSLDDVGGVEGNVLDTGTTVVLAVLGDLGLLLAHSGLVDGHLDLLGGVSHDDGAESRVLGVDLGVIDGPEAVEAELLLVHLAGLEHLTVGLVADTVVNVVQADDGEDVLERVLGAGKDVSGEEETLVSVALDKGVLGVTIGGNGGHPDRAVLVLLLEGGADGLGTLLDGAVVDGLDIVDGEGNILDTITVEGEVVGEDLVVGVQGRHEDKGDLVLLDDVGADITVTGLEAAVGDLLEAEASAVEGSSLLGVSDPEDDVVESLVVSNVL